MESSKKKTQAKWVGSGLAASMILLANASVSQAQNQGSNVPPDVVAALRAEIAALRAEMESLKASTKTTAPAAGGTVAAATTAAPAKPAQKKWYDTIQLRGYMQMRYNRLLESNKDYRNEQGDRSIGRNGGFFLRRARLIFSGQINDHVSFYLQPDLASNASSTNTHFAQLRDAYVDIGVNRHNELRFRLGQSKIPYGFENLQSSQNRLALDRNDALNSALSNERDFGVMMYWAPKEIRDRFAMLVSSGLKGSGDYGVLGLGVYNGQTANKPELNDGKHYVARATYPFLVGRKQIIETSLQHYSGTFTIPTDQTTSGVGIRANRSYADERTAASFILYPQPFGLQAEYNWGKGPEFDSDSGSILEKRLKGGYIQAMYMMKAGEHTIIPFLRAQTYNGGKKHETDARSYGVREYEVGAEWQPSKQFEMTAMYVFARRRFEDFANPDREERGRLLRLQAQVNF